MSSSSTSLDHVQQRPERADSPAPLWAKHEAARRWCIVDEIHDSVVTLCRGRWDANDDYAIGLDPPLKERCGGCELTWMRRKRLSGTSSAVTNPADDGSNHAYPVNAQ